MNFNQDRFYFGRYYAKNLLIYSALITSLLIWKESALSTSLLGFLCITPLFATRLRFILFGSLALLSFGIYKYHADVQWAELLYIPLGICVGHITANWIHNAAHFNFKPRWLNAVVGELCALQQLSAGLVVWRFVHITHHSNPDDPVLDPHPPKGFTFSEFTDNARLLIKNCLQRMYLKRFGDTPETRKLWQTQELMLIGSRFLKTAFLYLLLGPKLFILFYLPSYVANVYFFAAFNFYTHQVGQDGEVEVINLDSTFYHKVCNFFLSGSMYHKNHHLKPKLFNPKRMEQQSSVVLEKESA